MSKTSQIFFKIYIYRIPFDCWEGVASFLDQSQSKVKVETNDSWHPIENCFKGYLPWWWHKLPKNYEIQNLVF